VPGNRSGRWPCGKRVGVNGLANSGLVAALPLSLPAAEGADNEFRHAPGFAEWFGAGMRELRQMDHQ